MRGLSFGAGSSSMFTVNFAPQPGVDLTRRPTTVIVEGFRPVLLRHIVEVVNDGAIFIHANKNISITIHGQLLYITPYDPAHSLSIVTFLGTDYHVINGVVLERFFGLPKELSNNNMMIYLGDIL